jgi:hypothetical protein
LGARVQHALRAFTPDDQKALSRTVRTYPKTDVYDLESALTSLGIGEAVVTVLSEKGAPTPVAWTRMRVPRSLMGAIGADTVAAAAKASPLESKYGQTIEQEAAPPAPVPASGSDFPPPPTEFQVPPMPEPAEPKSPAVWEEVLKNPAVKGALNTGVREIVKGIFGSGRRK